MKRFLALLMVVMMLFCCAACGDSNGNNSDNTTTITTESGTVDSGDEGTNTNNNDGAGNTATSTTVNKDGNSTPVTSTDGSSSNTNTEKPLTSTTKPNAEKPSTNTTESNAERPSTSTTNKPQHTHSYSKKITAATCTKQGYTTYTCSCGDTYVADYVSPSHQYTDYVCKICGYTSIPKGYTAIYKKEHFSNLSLDGKYILMCDIDMGHAEWVQIGTENNPFVGDFNGNGYCIKNMRIASTPAYSSCSGIFGYNDGTIRNLGIENLTVLNYATESGGLVAVNNGTVSGCYVTGKVSSTGYIINVGGLAGVNNGTINNCYALCDVSATATSNSSGFAGGLVGENSGKISNCYASGKIKANSEEYAAYGGCLVGHQDLYTNDNATITNCFATGDVQVTAKKSTWAGGIVGWTNGSADNCWYGGVKFTVKKGYTTTREPTNIYGADISAATLKTVDFQKQTLGWSTSIWNFVEGSYPTLKKP